MRSFLEFLFLHMSFGDLNYYLIFYLSIYIRGFLHSSVGKESACNAGNPVSITGLGRSPREENGYPIPYSCLENSMDRGAWWAAVHGIIRVGCH